MSEKKKLKVGIVGGSGLTGGEVLRILLNHPKVHVEFVGSKSYGGLEVFHVHRDLIGQTDLNFSSKIKPVDVLFLCLPHKESFKWMHENFSKLDPKTKIIDLGNDFRLAPEFRSEFFHYGLCEFNRDNIAKAQFIANPGCYATAIELGLLPLVQNEKVEHIHAVGITGATGAGKTLKETSGFNFRSNNISAYKTLEHQHVTEIKHHILKQTSRSLEIDFIPWRGNFTRGIFVSMMLQTKSTMEAIQDYFLSAYYDTPLVNLSPIPIDLKMVVGTSRAVVQLEKRGDTLAIHVALDNLLKGAAGQAVQNMNIMCGLQETIGLNQKAMAY